MAPDLIPEFAYKLFISLITLFQYNICKYAFTFNRVRIADNCRFGTEGMRSECAFDFSRSDPVTRYVHNIVNAAC